MNKIVGQELGAPGRASYFFLSYAHSPPLAGSRPDDQPDEWVWTFFGDLKKAVQHHASAGSGLAPGFFDQEIPPTSDWKTSLARALSSAATFVPLYSPEYLKRSWPGREWACYRRRLITAHVEDPLRRVMSVLWIPLPTGLRPDWLPEPAFTGSAPVARAYRENGLRALLRLAPYRSFYEQVVDHMAQGIVRLAETESLPPSPVPDIDNIQSAFQNETDAMLFAVVVAASPSPDALGAGDGAWRPFAPDQPVALAEYARVTAEQLDFAVLVAEINKTKDLLNYNPGVVLIDPSYIADDERREFFRSFADDLPSWVLPVMVSDRRVPQLEEQIRSFLKKPRSEAARRALEGVTSQQGFITLMPYLVAQAEREYLRRGPIQRSTARRGSLPRLTGSLRSADQPAPVPESGTGETRNCL